MPIHGEKRGVPHRETPSSECTLRLVCASALFILQIGSKEYRLCFRRFVCVCVCVCVCQASIAYQRLSHQLTAATIVEIVEAVPTRVSCAGIDSAGGAVDCKDVPAFSFDEASGSWF